MTMMEKIKLTDDLINENNSCTIRDYLDTVAEIEAINSSAVIPAKAAKAIKNIVPAGIKMPEVRPVIRSVAVAKRIGFAVALRSGVVYSRERDRWAFRGGAESMMLQAAFRNAYKTGKEILRTVINEQL